MEHNTLAVAQGAFLAIPANARVYRKALNTFPEIKGRALYADYSDLVAHALSVGKAEVLDTAMDFLELKASLRYVCLDQNIGMFHAHYYDIQVTEVAANRLVDARYNEPPTWLC